VLRGFHYQIYPPTKRIQQLQPFPFLGRLSRHEEQIWAAGLGRMSAWLYGYVEREPAESTPHVDFFAPELPFEKHRTAAMV
jgi:hypothetical protein